MFLSIDFHINVVLIIKSTNVFYVYRVLDSRHLSLMFIFLIFPTMLRWTTKKHFLSLFWILRNVFLPWVLSLIINNWTLSWDCISPDLKQGTKHSDETFINSLSKIKHKNENLCHKKSQTSYKNWQIIEKSPKLVKKEAKSHKLAKEKSQTWEKSDKVKN